MSGPAFTATFTTQSLLGTADVATVTWELQNLQNQLPVVVGYSVITETDGSVTCTGGTGSFTVYGNDVINPSGTFYMVKFFSSKGELVATIAYSFVGSGSFDLSAYAPITTPVAPKPAPSSGLITSLAVDASYPIVASVINPNGPNTTINLSSTSLVGPTGYTGYTGYTGWTGPNSGFTGYTGYTGPQGPAGTSYSSVVAPTMVQQVGSAFIIGDGFTGKTLTISAPTAGNILVLMAMGQNQGADSVLTPPVGFTSVYSNTFSAFVAGQAQVWYRSVQAGDGTTYAVTAGGTGHGDIELALAELQSATVPTIFSSGASTAAGSGNWNTNVININYGASVYVLSMLATGGGTVTFTPAGYTKFYGAENVGATRGWAVAEYTGTSVPNSAITANIPFSSAGIYLTVVVPTGVSAGAAGPPGAPGANAQNLSERLFLGNFKHNSAVDATTLTGKFVSPIDGYVYTQADVEFYEAILIQTRAAGAGYTNGQAAWPSQASSNPASGSLYWTTTRVGTLSPPSGAVWDVSGAYNLCLAQSYWNGSHETIVNAGVAAVYVTVNRG